MLWLPVRWRISYSLNLIVFKASKGDGPNYIQSLLSTNLLPRSLRFGDLMYNLKEHRWDTDIFYVAALRYWNSLPDDGRNIELDLNNFKKRLKTFLFKSVFFIGVAQ